MIRGALLAGCIVTFCLASVARPDPDRPEDKPPDKNLQYRLQPGTNYVYRVYVEGEWQDQISAKSGEVWYSLVKKRKPEPPKPDPNEEPLEASGTAFVVSSSGHLVSCAHVVKDARQIEVTLGEKKYPAVVLATDRQRDLALLKVEATNLPALRLADSKKVELGQETRAIGFPLSAILGDSIKVTRGSIAGFIKHREFGHNIFQIDGSLNFGNSGGPLVNEMGEAIGVNFAKLDGALANNVGFATPINFVKDLLKKQNVAFQSGDSTTVLAGPELVRRVAPSVAFVHVKLTPPVPDAILQLRSRSYFRESTRRKGTARKEEQHLRDRVRGRPAVRIEIDELGNVWKSQPSDGLPWLLGSVSDVMFVPLPEFGQPAWEVEFQTGITLSISARIRNRAPASAYERTPRRYGRRGLRGREPRTQTKIETATVMIPAVERHIYRLTEQSETEAVIVKDIEFKSLTDEGLRFDMKAKGRIVFDKKAGVPKSMTLTGELIGRNNDKQEINPFRLEFSLKDTRPVAADALGRELVETMKLPQAGDEFDELFRDIISEDARVAQRAIRQLRETRPRNNLRADIARLLLALLSDPDATVRNLAVDALVKWASDETVPALIARLNHREPGREEVFVTLARLKDPRAVKPIAEQLPDGLARGAAVRALVALALPSVEETMVSYVADPDSGVREAACQVLEAVGTETALPALKQQLKADANERVAKAAYEAIAQIYVRAGKKLPADVVAPRALAARAAPPAAPAKPRNLPPLLRVFEDEADFGAKLTQGGGQAVMEAKDKYSGNTALKVTGVQLYNARLDALNVNIREKPGADEYRYLRFAWKKPAGRKPVGLQIACNGGWQLRYHSGAVRNPWGDSNLISRELPTEWEVVTRDLFAEYGEFTLTGIALDAFDGDYALFDHIYLAKSLDEFPQVIHVPAADAPPKPPAPGAPRPAPPKASPKPAYAAGVHRVFEDEASFARHLEDGFGGGKASLIQKDRHSGTAAIKVTPLQAAQSRLPGFSLRIREQPGEGEFRYLRFAWKKSTGQEPIGLQLANNGRWGFRLHSGPGAVRWGDSTRVDPALPKEWTVVTRDLFADFGEFTLTGIALDAFDGEYALFDHIYLARSLEELRAKDDKD